MASTHQETALHHPLACEVCSEVVDALEPGPLNLRHLGAPKLPIREPRRTAEELPGQATVYEVHEGVAEVALRFPISCGVDLEINTTVAADETEPVQQVKDIATAIIARDILQHNCRLPHVVQHVPEVAHANVEECNGAIAWPAEVCNNVWVKKRHVLRESVAELQIPIGAAADTFLKVEARELALALPQQDDAGLTSFGATVDLHGLLHRVARQGYPTSFP
eukprot:CAMPEP_0176225942 /NCGR_PEP_ID=MMETSP0121_2-20121125/22012_1 /TAXON_ID=160619 /ORGANISM="Kryptoperidinium foliaceum, Strain CCMP 1326" /LENGTH=221 /DNA_ID=CAMNT_0017565207 /DNA_START=369 /DNA_END=1033 /DNA_ORIENTATION=+